MHLYDINVLDNKGNEINLGKYKGKVLLIVNTATGCGFTPQYNGLEELYKKYKEQGFEILDFPCNQFFKQAPGDDEQINTFCTLNFGTTFDRFKKIDVNGKNEIPLYTYLKEKIPGRVKWNFTKFLIDRNGEVVDRFAPNFTSEKIEKSIIDLL